ncbi:MAG: hypothetical protein ACSW8B_02775 [bacterium]
MEKNLNSAEMSSEIVLSINHKLHKESSIFHKVLKKEGFTKDDVVAYAYSQVKIKEDELALFTELRDNYVEKDYMPDVKKIETFNNLIEGAKINIDFYNNLAKEFSK